MSHSDMVIILPKEVFSRFGPSCFKRKRQIYHKLSQIKHLWLVNPEPRSQIVLYEHLTIWPYLTPIQLNWKAFAQWSTMFLIFVGASCVNMHQVRFFLQEMRKNAQGSAAEHDDGSDDDDSGEAAAPVLRRFDRKRFNSELHEDGEMVLRCLRVDWISLIL